MKSTYERFTRKINETEDCWLWTAGTDASGYGLFYLDGRDVRAHRLAYEMWVGAIPAGLELDHICHTYDLDCLGGICCPHRRCVNPEHLEAVTPLENILRGMAGAFNSRKTHCPQGHSYDEANTRIYRNMRICRACDRIRKQLTKERYE